MQNVQDDELNCLAPNSIEESFLEEGNDHECKSGVLDRAENLKGMARKAELPQKYAPQGKAHGAMGWVYTGCDGDVCLLSLITLRTAALFPPFFTLVGFTLKKVHSGMKKQ